MTPEQAANTIREWLTLAAPHQYDGWPDTALAALKVLEDAANELQQRPEVWYVDSLRDELAGAVRRAEQAERALEVPRFIETTISEWKDRHDAAVARADALTRGLYRLIEATEILSIMLREPAAEGLMTAEDYRTYLGGAWLGVDEAIRDARAALAAPTGDAAEWQYTSEPAPDPHALCCRSCRAAVSSGGKGDNDG